MTRLTNDNTDVNQNVDQGKGSTDAQIKGTGPEAAGKDSFARQANKGILSEAVAQELNVPVGEPAGQVAGAVQPAEPGLHELGGGLFGAVQVTAGDARPGDAQFPGHANRRQLQVFVQHVDLHPRHRLSDRYEGVVEF